MYLGYGVKTAIKSIIQERWINLLCILTVASSLLIITLTALFLYNIEIMSNSLHERFGMVVFFDDKLGEQEIRSIISGIQERKDIADLRYISKDAALKELKERLKDTSYIFEGLEINPLSPSLEIRIRKEYVNSEHVKKITSELKAIKGIDEVYSAEKLAETIYSFYTSLTNLSILILVTLSIGVIFVVYSTVKILFYRRKEEIETIKLLGATRAFVRMPFLVEGAIIGIMGSLAAVIGSLLFYFAVTYRLSFVFPVLQTLLYPVEIAIAAILSGIVLGITGAFIAVGRLKF